MRIVAFEETRLQERRSKLFLYGDARFELRDRRSSGSRSHHTCVALFRPWMQTLRGAASIGNSRQAAFVHGLLFFPANRPLHVIRIADRGELLGRNLDRFAVEARKAIETELTALAKDPNENRKAGRRKRRAAIFSYIEPVHDLAVNLEQMCIGRR